MNDYYRNASTITKIHEPTEEFHDHCKWRTFFSNFIRTSNHSTRYRYQFLGSFRTVSIVSKNQSFNMQFNFWCFSPPPTITLSPPSAWWLAWNILPYHTHGVPDGSVTLPSFTAGFRIRISITVKWWIRIRIKVKIQDQNGAVEGHRRTKWKRGGSKWRTGGPVCQWSQIRITLMRSRSSSA